MRLKIPHLIHFLNQFSDLKWDEKYLIYFLIFFINYNKSWKEALIEFTWFNNVDCCLHYGIDGIIIF